MFVALLCNGFLTAVLSVLVFRMHVRMGVDAAIGMAVLVLVLYVFVGMGVNIAAMIVLVGVLFAIDRFAFHESVFIEYRNEPFVPGPDGSTPRDAAAFTGSKWPRNNPAENLKHSRSPNLMPKRSTGNRRGGARPSPCR